jgi:hypothetical protein
LVPDPDGIPSIVTPAIFTAFAPPGIATFPGFAPLITTHTFAAFTPLSATNDLIKIGVCFAISFSLQTISKRVFAPCFEIENSAF